MQCSSLVNRENNDEKEALRGLDYTANGNKRQCDQGMSREINKIIDFSPWFSALTTITFCATLC